MTTRSARHAILSETATFDKQTGELRVVIETPKGSRNKYDYDPDCDCLELATVLPEGMSFPYDFGFVPSTLGEDGDPLDILVLMDAPVVPGCVIRARPIGAIEATLEAGLRVPEDIAFVGCGNMRYNEFLRVPLSSIEHGTAELGRIAGELAMELANKPEQSPRSILVPPTLVARTSTAPKKA